MNAICCCIIFALSALYCIPLIACRTLRTDDLKSKGPYKVYRIYPNSTEQLKFIENIWKTASKYQLNFWKEPTHIGSAVDLMVPGHMQQKLENLFKTNDVGYMVTIQDVKKLILERERSNDEKRLLFDDSSQKVSFDFTRYHDYEDMRTYMRNVEAHYPNIARVYNLGFSHENRPIEMIKIGFPLNSNSKKGIWVDAGIHAREWASHSTAIYFIHQLVTKYELDPYVTRLVQNLTWYITPVVNPDGYMYTRSSVEPEVRMWRKNRSPNLESCGPSSIKCCKGVDLNRNFDFHFGESGSSTNPCDEVYQGSRAFSEPESRAVRDFLSAHQGEIEAMVTMHTYSQLWIHSFGHERGVYPTDVDELKDLGITATKALEKLYGTRYRVGSGADTLYVLKNYVKNGYTIPIGCALLDCFVDPASGGSDDWSKAKGGVKYVYLLELRPEENVFDGFVLDTSELIPTGRETWAGVKAVAHAVLQKNKLLGDSDVGESAPPLLAPVTETSTTTSTTQASTSTTTTTTTKTSAPTTTTTTAAPTTTTTTAAPTTTTTTTLAPTLSTTEATTTSTTTTTTTTSPPTTSTTQATTTTTATSTATTTTAIPSTSTTTEGTTITTTTTTAIPTTSNSAVPATQDPNCFDKSSEKRCARWVWHRVGICQRIVDYMSQNCARTCGFC